MPSIVTSPLHDLASITATPDSSDNHGRKPKQKQHNHQRTKPDLPRQVG